MSGQLENAACRLLRTRYMTCRLEMAAAFAFIACIEVHAQVQGWSSPASHCMCIRINSAHKHDYHHCLSLENRGRGTHKGLMTLLWGVIIVSFIFLLPPAGVLISQAMGLLLNCNFSVTKCVGSLPMKFDSIQFNIAISLKLAAHLAIYPRTTKS